MPIPNHLVIAYSGTHASISGLTGWSRYTAADGRHVKQIPTSSTAPGTTGGSAQHQHTTNDHTHTISHTHATSNLSNSTGTVAVESAGSVDTNADAHTHATGIISATTDTTEATNHPNSGDASSTNDPVRYDTIFLQSDGTPTSIPEGGITFFNNATLPPSWTQPANGKLKFLRGAAAAGDGGGTGGGGSHTHAGGAHTHSSDHVHPNATGGASATNTSESAGTLAASDAHTHVVSVTTANFGSSSSNAYNTSGTTTPDNPPWIKLAVITPPGGGDAVQNGLIALWFESLATIPSPDWILCDGNNGTPNLCQGLFVMGCDALTELLNTGGTATHTHTAGTAHGHTFTNTHTHVLTVATSASARGVTGSDSTKATVGHAHANSNSGAANTLTVGTASPNPSMLAADHSPLYVEAAFIQSVVASSDYTINVPSDANVAYGEILGTGRGFLGDTLNLWDDSQFDKTRRRIGWADAAVADRQVVASGAITVNVPADAMPSYSEQLGLAWLRLADAFPAYTETVSGEWTYPAWADSVVYDRQSVGVTAINRDIAADSLGLYTDQAPVVDKRGILTVAVAPDANAAYGERVGLGIELRGDTMPLADTAPTFTKIGFLTTVVPADSLGLYADQSPVVYRTGYLTANLAADPNAAYSEQLGLGIGLRGDTMPLADAAPTIDERGFLTAAPVADSLGLYADAPPIVSNIGILSVNVPADAWGTLSDQFPLFDKQVITTTPISVPVPSDSLGLYADQPPTFYETGRHLITPPADSLANYDERLGLAYLNLTDSLGLFADQPPTVNKVDLVSTPITRVVPSDSLGLYADTAPIIDERGFIRFVVSTDANVAYTERLGLGIGLSGDTMPLADAAPVVDKQSTSTTPVSVNVAADSLGLYADQAPTIDRRGILLVSPTADELNLRADSLNGFEVYTATPSADSLGLYADQAPAISKIGILTAAPATDSLGLYTDFPPTIDRQIITTTPKSAAPPADSLGLYADQTPATFETCRTTLDPDSLGLYADQAPTTFETLRGPAVADSLGLYADQAPIVSKVAALTVNVAADSLGLYADQAPVFSKIGNLISAIPADSLGLYTDQAAETFESYRAQLDPDSLGLYADLAPGAFATCKLALVDSIPSYLEYAQAVTITGAQVVYPLRLESEVVETIGLDSEFISAIELESEVVNIIPLISEI